MEHTVQTHPAERDIEVLAGLRELLDFLEAHPAIPIDGAVITDGGYTCYPQNFPGKPDLATSLDELEKIAAAIGTETTCPYGRHIIVRGPKFRGDVRFEATVCDAEDLWKKRQADNDLARGEGEVAGPESDPGPATAAEPEPEQPYALVDADGRCGCCAGTGEHRCGHECDSCDGSGRNPDSPVCRLPHGADCRCGAS